MKKRIAAYYAALIFVLTALIFTGFSGTEKNNTALTITDTDSSETDMSDPGTTDYTETEMRGVWIASAFNINFPSEVDLNASGLAEELDDILETVANNRLNTVFFQVRPSCDALYASSLFPVSPVLSIQGVLPDGFDPLKYLIEKAHNSGISVYAWINPLRVTASVSESRELAFDSLPEGSPVASRPDLCVFSGGKLWLDPGNPESRELVAAGIKELLEGYSVDAIVFDDYFYPYEAADSGYDDMGTYESFGDAGQTLSDFRRESVRSLIAESYEAVKAIRSDCPFGVSPFGIWRNASSDPDGSETSGFEAYDGIFCDALSWVSDRTVDFLAPQIYWSFDEPAAPFGTLLDWWEAKLYGTETKLYISLADYKSEQWGSTSEIKNQIDASMSGGICRGCVHYGYDSIRSGVMDLPAQLAAAYGFE